MKLIQRRGVSTNPKRLFLCSIPVGMAVILCALDSAQNTCRADDPPISKDTSSRKGPENLPKESTETNRLRPQSNSDRPMSNADRPTVDPRFHSRSSDEPILLKPAGFLRSDRESEPIEEAPLKIPYPKLGKSDALSPSSTDQRSEWDVGYRIACASLSPSSPFLALFSRIPSFAQIASGIDVPPSSSPFAIIGSLAISPETRGHEEESDLLPPLEDPTSLAIELGIEDGTETALLDDTQEPLPLRVAQTDRETIPKNPIGRTIRVPFGETDASKLKPIDDGGLPVPPSPSESNTLVPQHDPDSDPNQDEPPLMNRLQSKGSKEFQGEDAMQATKPGKYRKEVVIPSPKILEPATLPRDEPKKKPVETIASRRMQRVEACVQHYLDNPESTTVRSPWAVMHAILPYGSEYEMISGDRRVNAIGWVCHNGMCRTQQMFTPRGNSFIPNVGDGVQGHEGQFLAILAQSNVPLDYPIQIGKNRFTVEDLVFHEMSTCKERSELTFKLIGLSYYLDANKTWRTKDGKVWSIPKLIQEELAQPIVGSACGGTHRLMGLSFSLQQRKLQGFPINGQYARAANFIQDYVEYTWRLQNPDGSFSTNWYESRGNEPSDERKVQTSGHMLEWLMFTSSEAEIQQPRVDKAVDFLLSKIYDRRDEKWPIGPRGHATRALALYIGRKGIAPIESATEVTTPRSAIKPTAPRR